MNRRLGRPLYDYEKTFWGRLDRWNHTILSRKLPPFLRHFICDRFDKWAMGDDDDWEPAEYD